MKSKETNWFSIEQSGFDTNLPFITSGGKHVSTPQPGQRFTRSWRLIYSDRLSEEWVVQLPWSAQCANKIDVCPGKCHNIGRIFISLDFWRSSIIEISLFRASYSLEARCFFFRRWYLKRKRLYNMSFATRRLQKFRNATQFTLRLSISLST